MSGNPTTEGVAVLFPDTNFFLEFRHPNECSWTELLGAHIKEVRLMVCRGVGRELDRHKDSSRGRKQDRAQKFSDYLSAARRTEEKSIALRADRPRVTLARCRILRDEEIHPLLDTSEPDQRIVQDILTQNAAAPEGTPKRAGRFLTGDGNALAIADEVGLDALEIPRSWRLEPEPDASQLRIADLERRLKIAEAKDNPRIAFAQAGSDALPIKPIPLSAKRFETLDDWELSQLLSMVEERFPAATFGVAVSEQFPAHFRPTASMLARLQPRPDQIRRYLAAREAWLNGIRCRVAGLPRIFEQASSQAPFRLTIANTGTGAAQNLLIRLEASGGILLATNEAESNVPTAGALSIAIADPPAPPRPGLFGDYTGVPLPFPRWDDRDRTPSREPREIYFKEPYKDEHDLIELECGELLPGHARDVEFRVIARWSDELPRAAALRCTAWASNMPDCSSAAVMFKIDWAASSCSELARSCISAALGARGNDDDPLWEE